MIRGKKLSYILLGLILWGWGCRGTTKQIIPEGIQNHEHIHSRTKTIGDYHAQLVVNHRKGELALLIYDIYEEPKRIRAKRIEALMALPDGSEKKLTFKPDMVRVRRKPWKNRPITNSYYLKGDWLKLIHSFNVKFWVPIRGNLYEVSFSYETAEEEDVHHRHK